MKDVLGRPLVVGARVAVAFSYSQASVGHLRIGTIESLEDEESIIMLWEENNKFSPKMRYGSATRWIIL